MKVYVALMGKAHEDTDVLGVYTTEDLAIARIERESEDLMEKNEDYGTYGIVIDVELDDMKGDSYV